MSRKDPAEKAIRDIRRKTRKRYSAEEKIRIVLSGLRGEESIAVLCRHEGIAEGLYYSWSKEFLEAGKRCCQANANQSPKCEATSLSGRQLTPFGQCSRAVLLENFAAVEVAVVVEMIVDRGMGGGEFLQGLNTNEH